MNNICQFFVLLFLIQLAPKLTLAQASSNENKLLWKISHEDLKHDSYLYGTMHLRDESLFNFSDSVYHKLEQCDFFALEVHPDTMIKQMMVIPFQTGINKKYEDEVNPVEEEEKEILDSLGIDLSKFNTKEPAFLDLLINKFFKKEERRSIVDAHLYHIAKVLGKKLVGLESLEDRKVAWTKKNHNTEADKKTINSSINRRLKFKDFKATYSRGDIDGLGKAYNPDLDSSMIYRNLVMVSSAEDYFEKGSLFMAVGALHLVGEHSMVQVLKNKGYTVTVVNATFNDSTNPDDYNNRELPWVKNEYEEEGYQFRTPDKTYEFRPESIGGVIRVGIYPDLGKGHYYYNIATPILEPGYNLKSLVELTLKETMESDKNIKLVSLNKEIINGKEGIVAELKYNNKLYFKALYLFENNYLYYLGFSSEVKKEINSDEVNEFFNSLHITTKTKDNYKYIDSTAAFSIQATGQPQKYEQADNSAESPELNSTTYFNNFFDIENQIFYLVTYTEYNASSYISNKQESLFGYASNFVDSDQDTILLDTTYHKYDGVKIWVYNNAEKTHVFAASFIKGNRHYQLLMTSQNEEHKEKWENLLNSFELLPYKDAEWQKYNNEVENISASFPGEVLETDYSVDIGYLYLENINKTKSYAAKDKFSGSTFVIEEHELSPYFVAPDIDSLHVSINEVFSTYGDSIISSKDISYGNRVIGKEHQTLNSTSDLLISTRHIPTKNKLFRLVTRIDKSLNDSISTQKFFNSFTVPIEDLSAVILKDSNAIKTDLLSAISSSDSSIFAGALNHIYKYDYNDDQIELIYKVFNTLGSYNAETQVNKYESLSSLALKSVSIAKYEAIKKTYERLSKTPEAQGAILEALIEQKTDVATTLVSEIIDEYGFKAEYDWAYDYTFSSLLDSIELVKYLMPSIIDWAFADSSLRHSNLITKALNSDIITSKELEKYQKEIIDRSKNKMNALQSSEETWSVKSELAELSILLSYLNPTLESTEAFTLLSIDTVAYYKAQGIECLLRAERDVKQELIDELKKDNYNKNLLYDLQRKFPQKALINDQMKGYDTFAQIYADASLYEWAADEVTSSELVEKTHSNDKTHYIYKVKSSEESYEQWYSLLVSIKDQKKKFEIPSEDDLFFEYYYLEDENDLEGLEYLNTLIKE